MVSNGIDREIFKPADRTEARRALGLPLEGRLIAYVGRLAAEKGIDLLMRAWDLLLSSGPDPEPTLDAPWSTAARGARSCVTRTCSGTSWSHIEGRDAGRTPGQRAARPRSVTSTSEPIVARW